MHRSTTPPRFSFIFDFDSTLVSVESLDELLAMSLREQFDEVSAEPILKDIQTITDAGMNGEIDFRTSLQRRLKKARVHKRHLQKYAEQVCATITPGIKEVLTDIRECGCPIFIVSGGLADCILPAAKTLSIPNSSVFCNEPLFDVSGTVSGVKEGLLLENDGKTRCIEKLRTQGRLPGDVVMIGDGMSDWHPYEQHIADRFIGIGFHRRRPQVESRAANFFTSIPSFHSFIRSLLFP